MKRFLGPAIISFVVIVFIAMLNFGKLNQSSDSVPPQIITTSFPAYDFTRALLRDINLDYILLVSPGTDLHHYEPTTADLLQLSNATLIIASCSESETWLDQVLANLATQPQLFCMSASVAPLLEDQQYILDTESETDAADANATDIDYDEHYWTSPSSAIQIIADLQQQLTTLYPIHTETIIKNGNDYTAQLAQLDAAFQALAAKATKPLIVADRFPFSYFIQAYGFRYYAALPGCAEQTEASASSIAQLIDLVQQHDLKTIFTLELSSQTIAAAIATATNTQIRTLYSAQNISLADFNAGTTYYDLMSHNLAQLTEALL